MILRILWFTNTPSNASKEFGYTSFGGGWISSLEKTIVETKKFRLGICFLYEGQCYRKIEKEYVVYYGIPLKSGNVLNRIYSRHRALLVDENRNAFDEVINEFKPDLIHIFGTESGYGKSLMHRHEKILFNIQGLIGPCYDAFFPPGFNKYKVLMKSNLNSVLRGLTQYHTHRLLRKMAEREDIIIKNYKYFIGRTDWDRNYINLINPKAHYFHCEEMLRKEFFENEWTQPTELNGENEIIIGSTISSSTYKGLDLIYKVMNLIQGYNIRWKIFGIKEGDTLNKIIRKDFIKDKGSSHIEFYGQVNAGILVKQLLTCHLFVHPSYIDNSPNSVCEAMLLGMPVLASFVGGTKTLINNETTGFLFNPYDKYDLAGLLLHIINNYEEAKYAGSNSRQVALKRHSPETIILNLGNIYNFIYNDYL